MKRRRECFNEHRFSTLEILGTATDYLRAARIRKARATLRAKGYLV